MSEKKKGENIMAKLECTVTGNFEDVLTRIVDGIQNSSFTASLEDSSDFYEGNTRCSVRVFERYSYLGQNRVSLNLTLFQAGEGPICLSAITSGGSQAVLFKINTFGEENFLSVLKNILGI